MGQVFRCLRRAHFSDSLYHFDNLNKLARRWPTFAFLQPRRTHTGWIKTAPLHLAPYYSWPRPENPDCSLAKLLRVHDQQDEEQKAIQRLMDSLDSGDEPKVTEHPLAMGLACHILGGSRWLRKNRSKIHKVVLRSTTASYVALASGSFADDTTALVDRIATNPMLVLELAQTPILKRQLTEAWFVEALVPRPIFHALWLFMTNQERAAWTLLYKTAQANSVAAGICLGLDPHSENSKSWLKLAGNHSEALYWAGRIWQAAHDDIAKFGHAGTARGHLQNDWPWYYHWLRDLEWTDINAKVTEMWPDPWAVELIVDRGLSKDLVTVLCSKRDLDPHHPIESAVLLWAADYVDL